MAVTVIRKYPNRRLYDTSAGRYVNLDDVAALIRQGGEVQVVDVKTGEDVTRVVLTQIIAEDAKDQPSALPLELLKGLILATDRAVRSAAFSPLGLVKNFLTPEHSEVEDLRRRVEELEELARNPASGRKRARKPGADQGARPTKRR
jgi:polyhydroxyalkanoate synthesis repressor PhaR